MNRFAAPWERLRASFDPEADKPTLVQSAEELLATERAPRTIPARQVSESLLDLESRLDDGNARVDRRFDGRAGENGVILDGASPCSRSDGELEAAYDDAWSPSPRNNEPSHIGQVIDNRYIVESLIARGGMGIVYRCRHKLIDRRFAVKIIRSTMAHLPDAPRRFLMEAKAASAIGNEHIIDVVDYGTLADGSAYLVMELLEGVPLSDVIAKHETLPVGRITTIAAQMCEGLRAAHDAGIVHRDLKPENIFLTNRKASDFVKILDFGIAKMAQSGEALTKKGLIVGTPHYMSPEQAAGATVDARGDIYSLGVILYELATGRVPFDAVHYMAVLAKHMTEPPPPFHTLALQAPLPPDFENIVLRCLAKRPEQRFQTMTDVLVELERLSIRLRSPSRPSIEVLMPLASLVATDDTARGTGHSVPAAPPRSVLSQPKRRSLGLLLSALGLATLTGISVFRMHVEDEPPGGRGPRAARSLSGRVNTPAGLETVEAPLAAATASLASNTAAPVVAGADPGAPGPQPQGAASAASDVLRGPGAPEAPAATSTGDARTAAAADGVTSPSPPGAPAPDVGGMVDDTGGPLTTMEPLTVELAPGKSLEIEARTRLSLRLTKEARAAAEANAKKSPARKGARETSADSASGKDVGDADSRVRASAPAAQSQDSAQADKAKKGDRSRARASRSSGKGGSGKTAASKAGGGKSTGGKGERSGEARAPSELMNPWPSP